MVHIHKGLAAIKKTEKKFCGQSYMPGHITLTTLIFQLLIDILKFRFMLVVI